MECPKCKTLCRVQTYEGVEIDLCPRCEGIWLDGSELLEILDARQETFSAAEATRVRAREAKLPEKPPVGQRNLSCPKCSAPMTESAYAHSKHLLIDRCKKGCGIYLDKGEIEYLQILIEEMEERVRTYSDEHPVTQTAPQLLEEQRAFGRRVNLFYNLFHGILGRGRR